MVLNSEDREYLSFNDCLSQGMIKESRSHIYSTQAWSTWYNYRPTHIMLSDRFSLQRCVRMSNSILASSDHFDMEEFRTRRWMARGWNLEIGGQSRHGLGVGILWVERAHAIDPSRRRI